MAGAIVQSTYTVNDGGGSVSTFAATLNGVVAGNTLVAFCGYGNAPACTSTASDGTSYSVGDAQRNNSDNQNSKVFYLENAGSGTHTVTVTLSSAEAFVRLRFIEVSGLVTSSSLDKDTGQGQTTPGTGANAATSGASAATTNATDFVMGFYQDSTDVDPGSGTVSAGTGFTISGSNRILAFESKSVVATGAQTATFTQSTNTSTLVHVVAFIEATTTTTVVRGPYPRFPNKGTQPRYFGARPLGFKQGIPAGAALQTFSYTATGGLVFSGTSAVNRVRVSTPSGGLVFSGTAARNYVRVNTATGGLTFGGAATFAKGQTVVPAGGLTFGGHANQARVKVENVSGGIVFGGAASVSYVGTLTYSYTASGGIVFGGSSPRANVRSKAASGGILFSGAAGVSYFTVGGAASTRTSTRQLFTFLRKKRS